LCMSRLQKRSLELFTIETVYNTKRIGCVIIVTLQVQQASM
jgi:hypothetical protein